MVSGPRIWPTRVFTAALVSLVVLACCISETGAVLVYTGPKGHTVELFAAQLWYNGFWKHVRSAPSETLSQPKTATPFRLGPLHLFILSTTFYSLWLLLSSRLPASH